MNPLAIAALAVMVQQMGQASKQQRLNQALGSNPYYTPKGRAPVWNLADIGLMLYGLKGAGKGGSATSGLTKSTANKYAFMDVA